MLIIPQTCMQVFPPSVAFLLFKYGVDETPEILHDLFSVHDTLSGLCKNAIWDNQGNCFPFKSWTMVS